MIDLSLTNKIPLSSIPHKVDVTSDFGTPTELYIDVIRFLNSFPPVLGVENLRGLAKAIANSPLNVFAMGAHVIKTGCSPFIIDLINRGHIQALCVNGAFAIHDLEIAIQGSTSENVDERLHEGTFGWSKETASTILDCAKNSFLFKTGLGKEIGREASRKIFREKSVLAAAYMKNIPVAVMVAIGTDTIHMHDNDMGQYLGAASHLDFRIMAEVVQKMNGGVWTNIGSAVILPEVFLKLVSIAKNMGVKLDNLTTANLDMKEAYRTVQNVLSRPAKNSFSITGQHEILLPLLRMQILLEKAKTWVEY